MMKERLGEKVENWQAPPCPDAQVLTGRYAHLEPLNADKHAGELHRFYSAENSIWDYMAVGPFASAAGYHRWVREVEHKTDPVFYAIKNLETGHFEGVASFMRIKPHSGVIEVGSICFAPVLQKTRAATEAIFLMMQWAFDAGYRRFEWKCDALNIGSRRAAQRFGFSFEGIFRQHMVIKGRNRDTAWFAVTDCDWPALKEAYRAWLLPQNFNAHGQQIERLSDVTGLVRVANDPALIG